jgi:hypothetical protein
MDESPIQPLCFGEALSAASSLLARDFTTGVLNLKVRHLCDDNWICVHNRSDRVGLIQSFRGRPGRETFKARAPLQPPLGAVTKTWPLCLLTASYSLPPMPIPLDSFVDGRSGRPFHSPAP